MSITKQVGDHIRDIYFGGNWTASSLTTHIEDVTYVEATTEIYSLNTIASLVYHINYYVHNVANYFEGHSLQSKDAEAFTHPLIESEEDWQELLGGVWADGERFAALVEKLDDSLLLDTFIAEKYGNYFRNLMGIVEHAHYHLGQIVFVKKVLRASNSIGPQ